MKLSFSIAFVFLFLVVAGSAIYVIAYWPEDGVPVCIDPAEQTSPVIVTDSSGSTVAWRDYRNGRWEIYAQRIDGSGEPLWTGNGVFVVSGYSPVACPDWTGGVILAWSDGNDIYAQRLNAAGEPAWPPGGIAVCTAKNNQTHPGIASDGCGGAYLAWSDTRRWDPEHPHDETCDVYAQRIDSLGSRMWGGDRRVFSQYVFRGPAVTASSDGGALIAVLESAYGQSIVRAAKLNPSGDALWMRDLTTYVIGEILNLSITSDGMGGAIVGWREYDRIMAGRVNAGGEIRWEEYGTYVSSGSGFNLTCDGAGGAYISSDPSYIQWVDSAGAFPLGTSGIKVGPLGSYSIPKMISDGSGVTYMAFQAGGGGFFIQTLFRSWTSVLLDSCISLPGVRGGNWSYNIACGSDQGVLAVWEDLRNGNRDIYIDKILPTNRPPVLSHIGDREVSMEETLIIQLNASDPDPEDTLTFGTDASQVLPSPFSFDETTGLFQWTPAAEDYGRYGLIFSVSDGMLSDHETVSIDVTIYGNHRPELDPIEDIHAWAGKTVTITACAVDPDGDELVYSIDDTRFSRDGGVFTWQTTEEDTGTYLPVVSVTDGSLADSVTVTVRVIEYPAGIHDPLAVSSSRDFLWNENDIAWHAESDGYINADPPNSWYSAILSSRKFDTSSGLSVVFRVENTGAQNYIMGFSGTGPDESDYHFLNIEHGIYLHSTGSIRPTWDCNNDGYWNRTVPHGIYDCRITLSPGGDRMTFDMAEIESNDDPLSMFIHPVWTVEEEREFADSLHIQVNPYNGAAKVYDVWLLGEGLSVPDSVLQSNSIFLEEGFITLEWSFYGQYCADDFLALRKTGTGEFAEIPDAEIICDDTSCRFTDRGAEPGFSYQYRLGLLEGDEIRILVETEEIHLPFIPVTLYQNYPNPFNPLTYIRFYIPEKGFVTLDVYDVSGRRIVRLVGEFKERGYYTCPWDGLDSSGGMVKSGIYFYRLAACGGSISKKMVILR